MKSVILSVDSNLPIYEQIYNQIVAQILQGDLKANDMLPSIRTAAKDLGVSVITINRTWDDLERDGYIYTTPGKGTFVNQLNPKQIHDKRILILKDKLVSDLVYYMKLGIRKEDIAKIVEEVFERE
jgi:GntR family transcriptional regulator